MKRKLIKRNKLRMRKVINDRKHLFVFYDGLHTLYTIEYFGDVDPLQFKPLDYS